MVKTEEIMNLIKKNGYRSVYEFAQACGMDGSNVKKNIDGKYRPSIYTMFIFAQVLKVRIAVILYLFYPAEYEQYAGMCRKPI